MKSTSVAGVRRGSNSRQNKFSFGTARKKPKKTTRKGEASTYDSVYYCFAFIAITFMAQYLSASPSSQLRCFFVFLCLPSHAAIK
jgi:hypothetical protein